jgi:hypothetical protein
MLSRWPDYPTPAFASGWTGESLESYHGKGHQHERSGEQRGRPSIDATRILQEDAPGERVVAEERNRPEVSEGVEANKKRTRPQGGANMGQQDCAHSLQPARTECPGDLIESRVDRP